MQYVKYIHFIELLGLVILLFINLTFVLHKVFKARHQNISIKAH